MDVFEGWNPDPRKNFGFGSDKMIKIATSYYYITILGGFWEFGDQIFKVMIDGWIGNLLEFHGKNKLTD